MKQFFTLVAVLLGVSITCDAQYIPANRKLSNLLNNTAINASLVPMHTGKINLGSEVNNWNDFHSSGKFFKRGIHFLSSDSLGGTYLGMAAGSMNTGWGNTAIGDSAMFNNTIGAQNTATGYHALFSNTGAEANTAYGYQALYSNNGFGNDAFGLTLYSNTSGFFNVASGGYGALYLNTEGYLNTASGAFALVRNTTGWGNTAFGESALWANEINSLNTAIGKEAGGGLDYSNATFLGAFANSDSGLTNITALGFGSHATASNQVMVGNTSVTSIGGYANWSNFSDGRYKKNIKENVPGLEFIIQLRPVTYTLDVAAIENTTNSSLERKRNFNIPGLADNNAIRRQDLAQSHKQTTFNLKAKQEKEKIIHTGFIAQEVEQAAKKVNYDFSGVDKPKTDKGFYSLRYGDFIVPLVKAVQEQQKQIDEQQKQIEELRTIILANQTDAVNVTGASVAAILQQNVPNPFNQNTVIKYSVPKNAMNAQIIVTDMKGNLLKTFIPAKGEGQIHINSNELPAATYNYTLLLNGKKISTKQMILVK